MNTRLHCTPASNNHEHTAHDILVAAANKEATGNKMKQNKHPKGNQQSRLRSPSSPDGVSSWGDGQATKDKYFNMHSSGDEADVTVKAEHGNDKKEADPTVKLHKSQAQAEQKPLKPYTKADVDHVTSTTQEGASRESAPAAPRTYTHRRGYSKSFHDVHNVGGITGVLSNVAADLVEGGHDDYKQYHNLHHDDLNLNSPLPTAGAGLAEKLHAQKLHDEGGDDVHYDAKGITLAVENSADVLLQKKLKQLQIKGESLLDVEEDAEEEFPFDEDAEIVRHFGMEFRLASVRAMIEFMSAGV